MTATDETDVRRNDRPSTDEQTHTSDEPMVVYEFAVPSDEFVLAPSLRQFPDVVVEFEQVIPANHSPLPYLWANGGNTPHFRAALADDPYVEQIRQVATFDEGALYRIEWAFDGDGLLHWIANSHEDTALLQAQAHDDEWLLKLRFPSRAHLADFRTFYQEHDIDVRVVRLYDLTDPKMGEYAITEKQREALLRALEMGHFGIPREATLEDVAESLSISPKSLSERLRRGQTNLFNSTLRIGQPTGVGLVEQ